VATIFFSIRTARPPWQIQFRPLIGSIEARLQGGHIRHQITLVRVNPGFTTAQSATLSAGLRLSVPLARRRFGAPSAKKRFTHHVFMLHTNAYVLVVVAIRFLVLTARKSALLPIRLVTAASGSARLFALHPDTGVLLAGLLLSW